ncbi:MAG: hypothetical protein E6K64_11930 [Nitrospirae bacterium]|nr:MAG: hypothetical protein E6K64_11930 [Nitrospirota bacterium]
MKFYLREPLWSSTLTAFILPEGVFYDHLHDLLRERGYVIYAGQAQLAESMFRVANMGALAEANITGFLDAFEEALPEAQKRGEGRVKEMEHLQQDRKEKEEREKAEAEAAKKAEEEAARLAKEKALEEAEAKAAGKEIGKASQDEGKSEIKTGA